MQQLEFSQEELAAIKTELCKGATDEQFTLFISECKRRNLVPGTHLFFQLRGAKEYDPVLKVKVSIKKATWITKIDAMRLIAQRTGEYQGQEPTQYIYLDDDKMPTVVSEVPLPQKDNPALPREPWAARVSVHRKGFVRPFTATCRFDAYAVTYQGDKGPVLTEMWVRRGCEQLGKCTEVAALKGAFPEELGSLYIKEEFENQAEPEIETPPPVAAPAALVVPTVNHAPAVISNEARPNETPVLVSLDLNYVAKPGELVQIAPAPEPSKKRAKKVNIEDTPIEHVPDGFVATDDDLPAIMFEGPENVQKIDKPLSKKEIGDKVRSFYDMASAPEISKYILGYTGAKSSGEVTQQQWKSIFEAFDMLKLEGKEAFQQLLKGVAQ